MSGHRSSFRLGLVVAAGVESEFSDDLAVFADDAHVQFVYQDEDPQPPVSPAEADVVQSTVVAQRDDAAGIDLVASHPVVA